MSFNVSAWSIRNPVATTLLFVLVPVTIAVIPAAESVTYPEALDVSDRAMFGIRCTNSLRGTP